ncbi:MAG: T9SS type A sorting domain-containing protein [Saprospiraceae bacterium]
MKAFKLFLFLNLFPLAIFCQNTIEYFCQNAPSICNNESVSIDFLPESDDGIINTSGCTVNAFPTNHSTWIALELEEPGFLEFDLVPFDIDDDFDFILFQIEEDCTNHKELRCLASGKNLGEEQSSPQDCLGAIGLRIGENEDFEIAGCSESSNGYINSVFLESNFKYLLLINNYNSERGFNISFSEKLKFKKTGINNCLDELTFQSPSPNDFSINVYPNPVNSILNISTNNSNAEDFDVLIFDNNGSRIRNYNFNPAYANTLSLNIEDIPQGKYFVRVFNENYSKSFSFQKI